MHVLLQHTQFSPVRGGLDRRFQAVAFEFLSRGWKVSLLCPEGGIEDPSTERAKGFDLRLHPSCTSDKEPAFLYPFLYPKRLARFLRCVHCSDRPDLVVSFQVCYGAAAVDSFQRVPKVFLPGQRVWDTWVSPKRCTWSVVRQSADEVKRLGGLWLERKAILRSDFVCVESELFRKQLLQFYPAAKNHIHLLTPGIDTNRFQPRTDRESIRSELGVCPNDVVVLAAGRLDRTKNVSNLLDVLERIRERPWRLLVAGDGPERSALQERIRAMGLETRVKLLGFRDDMDRIYCAADVFALPTLLESCGRVFLEAMSAGLPCLIPRGNRSEVHVGVGELLNEECGQMFIDPLNIEEMVSALDALLSDSDLRTRLGKQARLCCLQTFSWWKYVSDLLQLVEGHVA